MSSVMSSSTDFKFVYIPADASCSIEIKNGDSSGGLQNDYLVNEAKRHFFEESGGDRSAALDNASPEERKALADQIRQQSASSPQSDMISKLDDDSLLNFVKTAQSSASCEIMAVTVPTKSNHYHAVSMYAAQDARTQNLPFNPRATQLMIGCGHAQSEVYGNAFVGRCIDDEIGDVWTRVDFTAEDADSGSVWCGHAKRKGGGGGSGQVGKAAPSLSNVMSQQSNALSQPSSNVAGEENTEDGYKWSQTKDEVELKFGVAKGTKAKYVKVLFGRGTIKITVAGQTLLQGETGGEVIVDDCTYTIQDDSGSSSSGRELCVTLGKKDEGVMWDCAVRK